MSKHPCIGITVALWLCGTMIDISTAEDVSSAAERQLQSVPDPNAPDAALKLFQLADGFRIQLVAAEPLIADPVAFEWGADGRLWVAEMGDYPSNGPGSGGRIRVLRDTNSDGVYDQATLFLDGLNYPNGVMPWRDGVLVTAAPDILYAEDRNGDGRADHQEVLYTGFREGNQQHRVNGFVWGLDNWFHCAQGDSGGVIESRRTGSKLDLAGRDFRIHPESGGIELVSGRTQFGRRRDDAGNWFGSSNSHPMFHYVLPDSDLKRNPFLRIRSVTVDVSDVPGASPCWPTSRPLARFNDFDRLNRFTSACSAMIFRDQSFPDPYRNCSYVSEPVHNLVHREELRSEGIVFHSRRADSERRSEFLTSSDNWFRPTMLKTGPDGSLWIADMYRLVIEHPEYIPTVLQARWNLRAGADRGRIYRVYHESSPPRPLPSAQHFEDIGKQVAQLGSPNGWYRDTAHRMLVDSESASATAAIRGALSRIEQPLGRLHALCALDGRHELRASDVITGLTDSDARVVRHAVRLARKFADNPRIRKHLTELSKHDDPFIQGQLVLTLGDVSGPASAALLGQLLVRHQSDSWMRYAVLSSLKTQTCSALVDAALGTGGLHNPGTVRALVEMAASMEQSRVVEQLAKFYLESVDPGGANSDELRLLGELLRTIQDSDWKPSAGSGIASRIESLNLAARRIIAEGPGNTAFEGALELVPRTADADDEWLDLLQRYLSIRQSVAVRENVVRILGEIPSKKARQILIEQLAVASPAMRAQISVGLLGHEDGIRQLFEAIENGQISSDSIPLVAQQQVLQHRDPEIRKQAVESFASERVTNRAALVQSRLADVNECKPDRDRGRLLFERHCSGCHRLQELGRPLGPDLAALSNRSVEALLTAILDPNRAVESRYQGYTALTLAGRTVSGMVSDETSTGITLVPVNGQPVTVLRKELEEFSSSRSSFMPEGLEKNLSSQDLADVIAFVAGVESPLKVFPGNQPEEIEPDRDGHFILRAAQAQIRGSTLVFEPQYGNLGFWGSVDDRATWTMQIPANGRYHVILDYACPDATSGNRFHVQIGGQSVTGTVVPTGSWNDYTRLKLTDLKLKEGPLRVEMRAEAGLSDYLLDLRAIHLIPKRR